MKDSYVSPHRSTNPILTSRITRQIITTGGFTMKYIARLTAALAVCLALLVPANSASSLTWKYAYKNGCLEYFTSGQHTKVTNVCKNERGAARVLAATIGGAYHTYCMPQHQFLYLGVRGEWKVHSISDRVTSSGCKANFKNGKIWIIT